MNTHTTLKAGKTYCINYSENGFTVSGRFIPYITNEELGSFDIQIYKNDELLSKMSGVSASLDIPKNESEIQKIIAHELLALHCAMGEQDEGELFYDKEFNNLLSNTVWEIE